nr:hydroxymethylbilane synthase [Bacilli bacterium]
MDTLRVGTRRSALAMTQTQQIIDALQPYLDDHEVEKKEIVTKGDRILDVSLSKVGGKGLFVSEIEQALLAHEIDFAVHSMKDVPAKLAKGLCIAAIPKRQDPRDLLITKSVISIEDLPSHARVGTSSLRRLAQLKKIRPDLVIEPLRGNIDTRLRKLEEFDAIILAVAGLARMGWWKDEQLIVEQKQYIASPIPTSLMIPAVGQGALAIECREDDEKIIRLVASLHDETTALCVQQERAFLQAVGGSCEIPVGAYSVSLFANQHQFQAIIGSADGRELMVEKGILDRRPQSGEDFARNMLQNGAAKLLTTWSSQNGND